MNLKSAQKALLSSFYGFLRVNTLLANAFISDLYNTNLFAPTTFYSPRGVFIFPSQLEICTTHPSASPMFSKKVQVSARQFFNAPILFDRPDLSMIP